MQRTLYAAAKQKKQLVVERMGHVNVIGPGRAAHEHKVSSGVSESETEFNRHRLSVGVLGYGGRGAAFGKSTNPSHAARARPLASRRTGG